MNSGKDYHKVVSSIRALLEKHKVSFKTFEHEEVRTSEEAAALRPDYTLSQGAKALIIRTKLRNTSKETERQFVQIVVPGDAKFDPKKVRDTVGAKDIRFATEEEVTTITDGVKPGGVPPFGNLFGLSVYADETLFEHDEIIFNAGDRCFSIAMSSKDYQDIVEPNIVAIV